MGQKPADRLHAGQVRIAFTYFELARQSNSVSRGKTNGRTFGVLTGDGPPVQHANQVVAVRPKQDAADFQAAMEKLLQAFASRGADLLHQRERILNRNRNFGRGPSPEREVNGWFGHATTERSPLVRWNPPNPIRPEPHAGGNNTRFRP